MMPIDTTKLRMTLSISATLAAILERLMTEQVVPTDLGNRKHPRVDIYRLRKAVNPFGVEIQSHRDLGYWLEEEDRGKLAALCGAGAGGIDAPGDPDLVAAIEGDGEKVGVDIMEGYDEKEKVDG